MNVIIDINEEEPVFSTKVSLVQNTEPFTVLEYPILQIPTLSIVIAAAYTKVCHEICPANLSGMSLLGENENPP